MLLPFSGVGELYFQVQHFNKKEFIQKLLYNEVSKKIKRQELIYERYIILLLKSQRNMSNNT